MFHKRPSYTIWIAFAFSPEVLIYQFPLMLLLWGLKWNFRINKKKSFPTMEAGVTGERFGHSSLHAMILLPGLALTTGLNTQIQIKQKLGVVLHIYNPSIWEAEAGGIPWVWGQPGLRSEFKISPHYIAIPCLKKKVTQNYKNSL